MCVPKVNSSAHAQTTWAFQLYNMPFFFRLRKEFILAGVANSLSKLLLLAARLSSQLELKASSHHRKFVSNRAQSSYMSVWSGGFTSFVLLECRCLM